MGSLSGRCRLFQPISFVVCALLLYPNSHPFIPFPPKHSPPSFPWRKTLFNLHCICSWTRNALLAGYSFMVLPTHTPLVFHALGSNLVRQPVRRVASSSQV